MSSRSSRIIQTLTHQFSPTKLLIKNVSRPYENDGAHNEIYSNSGGESHFRITIVSHLFEGQPMVKRHRMIHRAISEEFRAGLHALTIHAKTQLEYDESMERMRKIREQGHISNNNEEEEEEVFEDVDRSFKRIE